LAATWGHFVRAGLSLLECCVPHGRAPCPAFIANMTATMAFLSTRRPIDRLNSEDDLAEDHSTAQGVRLLRDRGHSSGLHRGRCTTCRSGYTNCIWLHRRGEKTLSDTTTSGCQWLSWVSASTFDDLERRKAKGLGPARRRGVRLAGRFPVRTVRRGG
jgi:hypothetical protein